VGAGHRVDVPAAGVDVAVFGQVLGNAGDGDDLTCLGVCEQLLEVVDHLLLVLAAPGDEVDRGAHLPRPRSMTLAFSSRFKPMTQASRCLSAVATFSRSAGTVSPARLSQADGSFGSPSQRTSSTTGWKHVASMSAGTGLACFTSGQPVSRARAIRRMSRRMSQQRGPSFMVCSRGL